MPEDKGSRSQREEKVLQFWKDNNIFEKSLEKEAPEGNFVFYEGPPTANGRLPRTSCWMALKATITC